MFQSVNLCSTATMDGKTFQGLAAMRGPATAVHAAVKFKGRDLAKFKRTYQDLAPLLKPDYVRIDYVLVHGKETSEDTKKTEIRNRFERLLEKEGFSIKRIKDEKDETVYTTLHCSFTRLCEEAERVKLEMPLNGVSVLLLLMNVLYTTKSATEKSIQ